MAKLKNKKSIRSFEIINKFIQDVYGFDFIEDGLNGQTLRIVELKQAYGTIMNFIDNTENQFSDDFIRFVYPLLEIAVQWDQLKREGKLTETFLDRSKSKFKEQTNFYGTIFELDMGSRFLLSDWEVNFNIEDYTKEEKQIDFVAYKSFTNKMMGIECTSKKFTSDLTVKKINRLINKKSKKFEDKYLKQLSVPIDEKLLIIDITRANYQKPTILSELDKIKVSSKLDGVILTWRELEKQGKNCTLKIKYECVGMENKYFSVTYLSEFRFHDGKSEFLMRKYIEPEPQVGPLSEWKPNPNFHK